MKANEALFPFGDSSAVELHCHRCGRRVVSTVVTYLNNEVVCDDCLSRSSVYVVNDSPERQQRRAELLSSRERADMANKKIDAVVEYITGTLDEEGLMKRLKEIEDEA